MEIRGHEIKGAKIVAMDSYKEVGKVKDLVWDPIENKIIAFITEYGDQIKEAKLVPFSEVQEMNKQAIFTYNASAAKNSSEVISTTTASKNPKEIFQGSPIRTADGKKFGNLRDIIFDSGTGEVKRLEIENSSLNEEIKPLKIETATNGLIIIQMEEDSEKTKSDDKAKNDTKFDEKPNAKVGVKKSAENLVSKITQKVDELVERFE